ncbi:hypothetical protein D3C76_1016120 [compost metagenome]
MQADDAGDEGNHHHTHHHFRTDRAEGVVEDGADRVLVGAIDHRLHVRHGEDQRQAGEHRRDAADVDGHAHGHRDLLARVRGFFGHVAAGLEAVVQEHPRQRGGEKGRQVRAVDADVEGVEQHADRLMAFEDQQVDTDDHRTHQFAEEAEHGNARQHLGAAEVDQGGEQRQYQGNDDVGVVARFKTEHGGQVRAGADGYGGNRDAQGDGVDPADHPRPALAHQATRPRVYATGNRELRNHFTKDQAHQQLAAPDQQVGPEHRRPAGGEAQAEEGIDPYDWREIGEAQGEVFPQAHAAIEVGRVAQFSQLLGVAVGDGGREIG